MHSAHSTFPPLIQRMLQPDFYPHETAGRIDLLQTPISYVLLTGPFAYKIKKPVKLAYLDFSTLDLRRHFCEEELRLNRRAAAEIYLDVAAISKEGDEFHLGGPGQIIEYALKMQQFDQSGLFSSLLAEGHLEAGLIEELARMVSRFHATAAHDAAIAQFGRPEVIRKVIEANYTQTAPYVGSILPHERFQAIQQFVYGYFEHQSELLMQRVSDGHIRECHGDLHLGNICLWKEKILLFDCIEFSQSLRLIDVMNDAAFTAMDLEASGRSDLANLFMNVYVEQTGDWEGLRVLPLYLCARAFVRGMVNALLTGNGDQSADDESKVRHRAEAYFELAWKYTLARPGRLILVSGVSGSGKSTLARAMAQRGQMMHIRSDAVRKHLAGLPLDQHGSNELYSPEMTRATYARLVELGVLLAKQGFCVILDAKFNRAATRRAAIEAAQAAGIPLQILQCIAPEQVLRARMAKRTGDISDATPDLIEQQRAEFEAFGEGEKHLLTLVDTSARVDLGPLIPTA